VMKETITSTRFLFLALVAVCATILCALNKLSAEAWYALVVGISAGFGVAIVSAKTAANMANKAKILIPFIFAGALLSGCMWKEAVKISVDVAGPLAAQARIVGEPSWKEHCDALVAKCIEAKDAACQPLVDCQLERHGFFKTLMGIQSARVAGYTAILANNRKEAEGWASAIKTASEKITATLKMLGVLP